MAALPQDLAGKLAMARQYKVEGNEFFKQENYKKAKTRYATALAFTKGLPGRESRLKDSNDPMSNLAKQGASNNGSVDKLTSEENDAVDELDAIIKTNIATCLLKLGNSTEALAKAKEAKGHLPTHWKADLRIAEAYEMLKNYDQCLKVLDELSVNPTVQQDKGVPIAIKKLREKCAKGQKAESLKQKKVTLMILLIVY
jgi:tetratricopeptide (TPR) repeat protein